MPLISGSTREDLERARVILKKNALKQRIALLEEFHEQASERVKRFERMIAETKAELHDLSHPNRES